MNYKKLSDIKHTPINTFQAYMTYCCWYNYTYMRCFVSVKNFFKLLSDALSTKFKCLPSSGGSLYCLSSITSKSNPRRSMGIVYFLAKFCWAPVRKAWVKKNPETQKTGGGSPSYQSCKNITTQDYTIWLWGLEGTCNTLCSANSNNIARTHMAERRGISYLHNNTYTCLY